MATALEVVRGISQVMANAHDGAHDKEGNPVKTGLKREEKEWNLRDRRVIDGFKLKLQGENLILTYHSECLMKDHHDKKFEEEIERTISEVLKFIKKEYKKVVGETLSLKQKGKMDVMVESTSRIRTWVRAQCVYEIKNLEKTPKEKVDNSVRDWLKLGKNNVTGW
jgi:hypothetical protein